MGTRLWRRGVGAALAVLLLAAAGRAEEPSAAGPTQEETSPGAGEAAPAESAPAPAEEDLASEVALTRAAIQVRRQALVTAAMDLEPGEAEAFWPVYREYREAMGAANDRFAALLVSYLERYDTLTDQQATQSIDDFLGIEQARLDVKNRFVPRFREILPARKAMRFFQVDHKLDAVIDAELAASVPLAR